ncbi:hypothetical protein ACIBQ1_13720 [Nonomuraea sp. NPDC050153]|uniref:hypothetical protein n=1 Tax=Nonomuraea sp. NPDC050153 TaxID=3364359 RepID=UPI0037BA9DEF
MAREQALSGAELDALLRVANENVRQVVAQAATLQDWTARQLSVLRNTYPSWDIDRERDPSGQVLWTARLRQRLTVEMVTAGAVQSVRQPDAIALASALSWQSYLIHSGRRPRLGPP